MNYSNQAFQIRNFLFLFIFGITNIFAQESYVKTPPIPHCYEKVQISLSKERIISSNKVLLVDCLSTDNCDSLYFKVLRIDQNSEYDGGCLSLNGDDDPSTGKIDVWYDDEAWYCIEDNDQTILTKVRAFDIDPGQGSIDPNRMKEGGDLYGRFGECQTQVMLQCKFPVTLTCPDVSVSCSESLNPAINPNLKITVDGGCGGELTYKDSREEQCSKQIIRTWTHFAGTNYTKCTQTITLPDSLEPFDPCTIILPGDTVVSCSYGIQDVTMPHWEEGACNLIEAKFYDDTFTFVGSNCQKIVRDWIIIDWCTYMNDTGDQEVDPIKGNKYDCTKLIKDGYYRYTQILQINDDISPTIITEDQCIGTSDCYAYPIELQATGIDSCNFDQSFFWNYLVTNTDTEDTIQYSYNYKPNPTTGVKGKKSKDDLISTQVGKLVLLGMLPVGNYKVNWTVGDRCGNKNSTEQFIEIQDKTAPTPIMVDIATAVMTNGKVEIKAKAFDKGGCANGCIASFDNCTPKDGLFFTFTDHIPHFWTNPIEWANQLTEFGKYFFDPNTGDISTEAKYLVGEADAWLTELNTSQRIFLCENYTFPHIDTIKVYVFDKFDDTIDNCDNNNFDFAEVKVKFKGCLGDSSSTIQGLVRTPTGIPVEGMDMDLNDNYNTKTDNNGNYTIDVESGNYTISGFSYEEQIEGITERDIILLDRSMLGILEFDNPYKKIASLLRNGIDFKPLDINSLQYLLLRQNVNILFKSWVAVSDSFNFGNPPYNNITGDYLHQKVSSNGQPIKDINFMAVKLGDLDFSALMNPPARQNRGLTFLAENKKLTIGEVIDIPIYAKNYTDIRGLQLTMNTKGMKIVKIIPGYMNIVNDYNVLDNNLLIIWKSTTNDIDDDDLLFTLRVKATKNGRVKDFLKFNDNFLRTEAYFGYNLEIDSIHLDYKTPVSTVEIANGFNLYQNIPNPFTDKTTIGFDLSNESKFKLSIFDLTGRKLTDFYGMGKPGYNSITIDLKNYKNAMMIYKLKTTNNTAIKKMIKQ